MSLLRPSESSSSAAATEPPGTISKRRLLDPDGSGDTLAEQLHITAGRLLYAPQCGIFYLSLLGASIAEIVWISHPWLNPMHCCRLFFPTSRLFFFIEAYLTLGLVAETTLTLLWQRKAFWSSCTNLFDVTVCAMSLFSFALYWCAHAQRATASEPHTATALSTRWHNRAHIAAHNSALTHHPHTALSLSLFARRYGGGTSSSLARLDELVLLIMVGWLALRIARLTAIVQKIRERHRRGLEALDVAFPDGDDDDDESEDEMSLIEAGRSRGDSGVIAGAGGGGVATGAQASLVRPPPSGPSAAGMSPKAPGG